MKSLLTINKVKNFLLQQTAGRIILVNTPPLVK